ncbi:PXMP2/4 family protein [Actinidia chinensis var. chinensis]|uniref:PXMP2/4 family protein n=1 Tax=Actinidia chinensis var. chinensis TaxID=1590841 RepID=A0A2R6QY27_ACTCC|nr:PXMP2/4 family protein [Actinidia chinensis var. chinensis]
MGIGSTRNVTKFSILQLWLRRTASNSGVCTHFPSLSHHHHRQCRAYARTNHQLIKPRVSETPRHFNISSPSNSYSSSSSSSSSSYSRMGFLGWYLGMLESRPVVTKVVTSSIIYTAADLTSHMITLPPSGSFDSMRTLRMAGFGMLIVGPAQHMWFNFVARILPKRDVVSTLKKLIMGQILYGPCLNGVFFSYNAALQGENGSEIVARLKRDLLPTLINGLMFWPVCDFLTYKVIPVHLQPLMNSSFSYIWTIYLTYMASLMKARTD